MRNGKFRAYRLTRIPMRISDLILKSVVFIGEVTHKDSAGQAFGDLHGTGFLVTVPDARREKFGHCYLVTAKHVAEDLQGREVYLLVNKKGGGVKRMTSVGNQWILHPSDETADVAVVSCTPDNETDFVSIGIEDLATAEMMRKANVGIGDEIFLTGLFTPAQGEKRNIPIVRHGNIAMIPEEKIQTEYGYADVYLVETRSLPGISGSPVFARETVALPLAKENGKMVLMNGVGASYCIGVMHGHWDIKESELNKVSFIHDRQRGVNIGIGIVTPADKIIETLNRPELMKAREEVEKRERTKMIPGMDSANKKDREREEETTFTKTDFEAALKKVSRKVSDK